MDGYDDYSRAEEKEVDVNEDDLIGLLRERQNNGLTGYLTFGDLVAMVPFPASTASLLPKCTLPLHRNNGHFPPRQGQKPTRSAERAVDDHFAQGALKDRELLVVQLFDEHL